MGTYYCPQCDADLELQEGFRPTLGFWKCKCCGFRMTNPDRNPEQDARTGHICRNCGSLLDRQYGFSQAYGTWECTTCGYMNQLERENGANRADADYDSYDREEELRRAEERGYEQRRAEERGYEKRWEEQRAEEQRRAEERGYERRRSEENYSYNYDRSSGSSGGGNSVANTIWMLTFGWIFAFYLAMFGVACYCTIFLIPLGNLCFRGAKKVLKPF